MKGKILVALPCLSRGGTEMQTLLLVRALVELGHPVTVCCYFERDERVVEEFLAAGAAVHLLYWSRSIGAIKFIRSLSAIFRRQSPAVVHVQYMAPGLLPIIAARLARIPLVLATVHQPGTPHGLKNRLLLRLGVLLTNYFICVSEAAERSWFGNACLFDPAHPEWINGRRHVTILNAVDIESIDSALAARSPRLIEMAAILVGKPVVGTVTRLGREKGTDILLKAFAALRKGCPQAHLLIVGDGIQRPDLQALAHQLGIGDAISWAGRLSWEEAMGCLGIMTVVAVPSRYEGFGLSAAEAMAAGLPVVGSAVDGLCEVIEDGVTGYLVPVNDDQALAARLIQLLNNPEQAQVMGRNGRDRVMRLFSMERFNESIRALYNPDLTSRDTRKQL